MYNSIIMNQLKTNYIIIIIKNELLFICSIPPEYSNMLELKADYGCFFDKKNKYSILSSAKTASFTLVGWVRCVSRLTSSFSTQYFLNRSSAKKNFYEKISFFNEIRIFLKMN